MINIELLYWTPGHSPKLLAAVEWPAVPPVGNQIELATGTYTVRYVKWVWDWPKLKVQVTVE